MSKYITLSLMSRMRNVSLMPSSSKSPAHARKIRVGKVQSARGESVKKVNPRKIFADGSWLRKANGVCACAGAGTYF
jgi:hypothetical protein